MTPDNLKEDFDFIFKETIAPLLKQYGFKRKAQNFARQTNDITQCFNVQKSQWNSYHDNISFTFNLGFFNQTIINLAWDKDTQIDFPKTTDCFIQERLGILSHNRDQWYDVNKRVDRNKTAEQVKSDLENYLIPLFEKYKSLNDLMDYFNKNEKSVRVMMSPYYHIVYLMSMNQIEKGTQLIKEHYQKAITPQASLHTINYPDGTSNVKKSKPYINQYYVDAIERLAKHYNIGLK